MLTLQELKQVVSNREERRKIPSAKYLRENEVAVAKQRLMDCAEIIAYQTGYVLYCVGDYATVFPLFTCRDYVYEAERKIMFLISHRLYLFPEFDQVIWMDQKMGTCSSHERLMAENPQYAELYRAQVSEKDENILSSEKKDHPDGAQKYEDIE